VQYTGWLEALLVDDECARQRSLCVRISTGTVNVGNNHDALKRAIVTVATSGRIREESLIVATARELRPERTEVRTRRECTAEGASLGRRIAFEVVAPFQAIGSRSIESAVLAPPAWLGPNERSGGGDHEIPSLSSRITSTAGGVAGVDGGNHHDCGNARRTASGRK
jgi:hypothetical protein